MPGGAIVAEQKPPQRVHEPRADAQDPEHRHADLPGVVEKVHRGLLAWCGGLPALVGATRLPGVAGYTHRTFRTQRRVHAGAGG